MPIASTLVSPYVPPAPAAGGVVGGKVIVVCGGNATHEGRFSVLDPSGPSQQAYQMVGDGGAGSLRFANHGGTHGGGVVVPFRSATGNNIQIIRMYDDGSYDTIPTGASLTSTPFSVVVGDHLWMFGDPAAPLVWDFPGVAMVTHSMSSVSSLCEPVHLGGHVYHWAGSTLHEYDASTFARSTITSGYSPTPKAAGRVAAIGAKAYWATSANQLICLDASTGTVSTITTGATFASLCAGPDGKLYGATSGAITAIASWDPSTLATHIDAISGSGRSANTQAFSAGGKLCFPAAK